VELVPFGYWAGVLKMCPCNYGRLGAFTVTACMVWALAFGGIPATVNFALAGNFIAIAWAVAAVFGVGWLCIGISEALSHDDGFNPRSVIFSAAVIGLAAYALRNGWYLRGDALLFYLSRAFWWGLIGSEVFAIWLNLRGRRHARCPVIEQPQPSRLRRRRRFTIEEEIEGHGIEAEHMRLSGFNGVNRPAHGYPDLIEHDGGAPQIVWVRDRNGNFIPVQLPDAVPVGRRLR
jgi:hypothetical protein